MKSLTTEVVSEVKRAVVVGSVLVVDEVHDFLAVLAAQDVAREKVVVAQAGLQAEQAPLHPATAPLLAICLSFALLNKAFQPDQLLLHLTDLVAIRRRSFCRCTLQQKREIMALYTWVYG